MALENIKNFKVSQVNVKAQFVKPGTTPRANVLQKRFLVTFVPDLDSSSNVGVQNNLVCESGYSCSTAGCAPVVKMPFLYRYAAVTGSIGLDLSNSPSSPYGVSFFAGSATNTAASFNGGNAANFVRLDASSAPSLPPGMSPDSDASLESARYDIRVVVATKAATPDASQPSHVWTRVTYGHAAIMSEGHEYVGPSVATGPWSPSKFSAASFNPSLLGMTYQGTIPAALAVPVAGAPGVVLSFPRTSMHDGEGYRFFEILIKLPSCTVTPLVLGSEFVDTDGSAIAAVDPRVENAECSNRGQCNRDTGLCECFSGFYGVACSKQTTMV